MNLCDAERGREEKVGVTNLQPQEGRYAIQRAGMYTPKYLRYNEWFVELVVRKSTVQHKNRPVNLNLISIKFPLPAIISILHRISGLLLFLLIPLALWCFELSLTSQTHFDQMHYFTFGFFHGFFFWVLLSALVYHAIAGVRHLLMDIGIGETKKGGNISAKIVFGLSVVLILLLGWWILL